MAKAKGLKLQELEQEYREVLNTIRPQIEEKIEAALKLLGEAEGLADKHHVPFYSPISPLGQPYMVDMGKFKDLDVELICDLTEVWDDGEGSGWLHSSVC